MFEILRNLQNRIVGYLGNSTNSNIFWNIIKSGISKGFNILFALFIVRFSLEKIGIEQYGVYLTVSTIVAWISLLDFGLVASLRNKLSFFYNEVDFGAAQFYIGAVYLYYFIIAIIASILIYVISYFINWSAFFNISVNFNDEVRIAVQITLIGLMIRMFLSVINSIIHAQEKSSHIELLNVLTQLLLLIYLYINKEVSLVCISLFTAVSQNFVYLVYTLIFFSSKKYLKPKFKFSNLSLLKNLKKSSSMFFIIQISAVLLYSTDNFLISHLFSPTETSKYNIAFKYFNIITLFWSTVLSPYWAAVSKEYAKGNIDWIKKSSLNLSKIWFVVLFSTIVMVSISSNVYKIWLNNDYKIPLTLSIVLGIYVSLAALSSIYGNVLNGIGRLKRISYVVIFVSILNVVIAVFLSKYTSLGFIGIPLATCVSQVIIGIVSYLEYKKAIGFVE